MCKISVIIPTYNRPELLTQAIESVLSQTISPYEIIVVDDNPSSGENYKVIEKFQHIYPIKYFKNRKRLGGAGNYKRGFLLSNGDFIKWLADDDILLPDALEKMSYYLKEYPDIKLVTSSRIAVDKNLKKLPLQPAATKKLYEKDTVGKGEELAKKTLLDLLNYIGEFSTVMFRKKDINFELFKLGNLEFIANSDWLTWLLLLKKGNFAYISEPLSLFRLTESNEQMNFKIEYKGIKELYEFVFGEEINRMYPLNPEEKKRQIDIFSERLYGFIKKYQINNEDVISLFEKTVSSSKKYVIKNNRINRESVSIIVVTYNSEKTIKRLLDSLLPTLHDKDEIIIVDNNSKDNTVDFLKSLNNKQIKVILNEENVGYSKGINIGIEASKSPIVIFLNPDTVVTGNWIDRLIKHLDKETGAVGPLSTYTIPYQFVGTYIPVDRLQDLSNEEIAELVYRKFKGGYKETKVLMGFCLVLRRETLEKEGYLDEDLFLGNDDLELSWRLRERGYKLKIALDTFIYHEGHVSFKTEKKSKTDRLVQESTNRLADKLINYYGYGNVPHPWDLWKINWFIPVGEKYKYMFKIYGENPLKNKFSFNKKVSIVVLNYKNAEDTVECIQSLFNLNYKNFNIIVVDNSEDRNEVLKIKEQCLSCGINTEIFNIDFAENIALGFNKNVYIIENPENLGFSGGNNVGIKLALKNNSDYIWILNNDTVVEKNSLKEMIKVLQRYNADVITCKIKDYKEKNLVQYNGNRVFYTPINDTEDIIRYPFCISGSNILIKNDVFKKVGLLDEDFFFYFEDNEFHKRLYRNNIKILYTPFTCIYHKGGSSVGGFMKNPLSVYYFVRNSFLFHKKTNICDYEDTIERFYELIEEIFFEKKLLKAALLGVYDFVKGKVGKRNDIETVVKKKNIQVQSNSEIDKCFELAFKYPRKKEYINSFIQEVKKEIITPKEDKAEIIFN